MDHILFWLITGFIIFDFLFERLLDYLNKKRWSDDIPAELKGIYDDEKYRKSQDYERVKHRFGQLTAIFSFVLILLMLFFDGFAWVDGIIGTISSHPVVAALLFFGVLLFASDILNLPFGLYATFNIEERFGFNRMSVSLFFFDKLKGWLLAGIIGGGILALFVWFWMVAGNYFWLYTWGLITAFTLLMILFYSNVIVPLFNKQTPLEEGELKTAIAGFANKVGFRLDNVYVIDGSKRSTKANAYFTGFGAKKRIVLYDTLMNDLATDEIVAVLAHEIGHYRKKHVLTGMFLSILQTGAMLYILGLLINQPELSIALGAENTVFHIGLVAFGLLYSPLSFLLGIGLNLFSRKNEYQADRFAAEHYNAESLISALKKLSQKNLSNLTPHPAYVFFHYSHPTLLQRVQQLKKI